MPERARLPRPGDRQACLQTQQEVELDKRKPRAVVVVAQQPQAQPQKA